MLDSNYLKNNPNLFVFLPMFYTVWSDAVLTPSEFATLEGFIRNQDWLSQDERSFLLQQLNPATPPSVDQLRQWREEIKKAVGPPGTRNTLADLGMKLAGLYSNGTVNPALDKVRSDLGRVESTLGFISQEVVYHFQEEHETIIS